MVRTAKPKSDNEKLSDIVERLAAKHGLEVYKAGWARTTYDVNVRDRRSRDIKTLVRVESFATTGGKILLLDPEGRSFAEELGVELEKEFPQIGEAVIVENFRE
ncbi:MAG: hypothetical protein AMS16_04645 [Planctomycetes bacterium DG_58]|nr:MAG: hypothetical protein AMS16_04645 [Planctomycetes bacterium DG_58]KPL03102.1 MAG: hypothetical protein AMK75_01880 [Planctomycetes bacterium SM23_65]